MSFNQESLFERTQDLISTQTNIFENKIDNIDICTIEVNLVLNDIISNICEEFEVYENKKNVKLIIFLVIISI